MEDVFLEILGKFLYYNQNFEYLEKLIIIIKFFDHFLLNLSQGTNLLYLAIWNFEVSSCSSSYVK